MAETMEAGREMDALVAERVMGWKRGRLYGNGNGEWEVSGKVIVTWDHTPRFSTDIAAAWEVVEKLRDHPDPRRRTLRIIAYSYSRTYAAFDTYADRDESYREANGEHATPLAICRAALAATGWPLQETNDG